MGTYNHFDFHDALVIKHILVNYTIGLDEVMMIGRERERERGGGDEGERRGRGREGGGGERNGRVRTHDFKDSRVIGLWYSWNWQFSEEHLCMLLALLLSLPFTLSSPLFVPLASQQQHVDRES